MELRKRAVFYARVINHLYGKRGIKGKLITATRGARHLSLGIRLNDPLKLADALNLANPLALATSVPHVLSRRLPSAPGLVSYQLELQAGYWQSYTRADVIGLGVGLAEQRRQVDFSFEDAPHALVAGATNCGKSVAVASILAGVCDVFTPDELKLVVIDPDFDYTDFDNVAHLAMPIAREQDQVDDALTWVGQELARRKEYNAREARRVLIVIDEAEDIIADEQRLAITQTIARGGRKFNLNLLVATQKPSQSNLPSLLNQLLNRWIGRCDSAQTSALLTGHAGLQAHKLTGAGDFLHINGAVERLQVAMPTRQDFDALPRVEVAWPTLDVEDTPRILNFPDEKSPGRPAMEIDPVKVAVYVWHGPDGISISQAREELELKRYAHYAHRDFAISLVAELKKLEGSTDE